MRLYEYEEGLTALFIDDTTARQFIQFRYLYSLLKAVVRVHTVHMHIAHIYVIFIRFFSLNRKYSNHIIIIIKRNVFEQTRNEKKMIYH